MPFSLHKFSIPIVEDSAYLPVCSDTCVHSLISSFLPLFAVPSEVQNLTITQNNETLLILWLDSSMPNGVVTYVISVTCFDLATNNLTFAEVYTVPFGGDLRIYIPFPGGLEPYAEYTATIIASTRAGNSSEMTDMLTTPQGGKTHTVSQLCTYRSSCTDY